MRLLTYPRVHIALADLAGATLRRYGGGGFAVNGLPTIISLRRQRDATLRLPSGFDERTAAAVTDLLSRLGELAESIGITVDDAPPQHVGLGSKTSLILGIAAGIFRLKNSAPTQQSLQMLSRRGGASGVGINTFFTGGFVIDGGHPANNLAKFVPSSIATIHNPPPVICRHPFPRAWQITLVLPRGHRYSGTDEKNFFEQNTPVVQGDSLKTIALLYHGVAAGVVTQDLGALTVAIDGLQRTGFKKAEIDGQSADVKHTLRELQHTGVAVGMSSMGPLLYAITASRVDAGVVARVADSCGATVLGRFAGRNKGYEMLDD
jgi:beta-ribofuranosylaminobenzene 5'-phosphate synthase